MARRILSLDLGSHTLKAVLLERTLTDCRVLGLFRQRCDPRRSVAEQLRDFCQSHDLYGDTVLSCLSGDAVLHRFLSLPFSRSRQLNDTVPFELESHIPLSLEEIIVDFHVVERSTAGVTVLAVAVPKATLTEHLTVLAAAGLDPVTVGLSSLAPLSLLQLAGIEKTGTIALLDIGDSRSSVALLRDGVLSGLRTLSVGLGRVSGFTLFLQELRWTLLALGPGTPLLPTRFLLCGGGAYMTQLREELGQALNAEIVPLPQVVVPALPEEYRHEQGTFAACLGLGLGDALRVTAPAINLRRGAFTHQGHRAALRRELTRLGWIAAGVAATAGLAFALEMYRLQARYEALRQEIRRVFTATLPEVQTIVSEKMQLQDAVSTLQNRRLVRGTATTSPLELLRQLSAALPEQISLDLDEWTFEADTVRLRGTTSSFDAAETIKTVATGLGLFREVQLKDVKTTLGGKKVSFGLLMFLKPGLSETETITRGKGTAKQGMESGML